MLTNSSTTSCFSSPGLTITGLFHQAISTPPLWIPFHGTVQGLYSSGKRTELMAAQRLIVFTGSVLQTLCNIQEEEVTGTQNYEQTVSIS